MKFDIEGVRTTTIVTTMVQTEEISGEINITKKEVMRVTECLASEDGDSKSWYSYVTQAIEEGARHEEIDIKRNIISSDFKEEENITWERGVQADWW
tara:strand:+ start:3699 stop:3989 length:291 start_codon:yes stop_codon:yes gene_type:complete